MPPVRAFVYGTVFGGRPEVIRRLSPGDRLILVPDPPGTAPQAVWVHGAGGDVVGHLSDQVSAWLVPWMLDGGRVGAVVTKLGADETESWKRVEIELEFR